LGRRVRLCFIKPVIVTRIFALMATLLEDGRTLDDGAFGGASS
jgi:hypothetical protein